MTKILVDVDDDALARAAARLGTATKKETIGRALQLAAQSDEEKAAVSNEWDEWADNVGVRLGEVDREDAWR